MSNGLKMPPEVGIQLPETTTKVAAAESGTFSRPLVTSSTSRQERKLRRNYEVMHVALRLLCLTSSLTAVIVMTTAEEKSTISIYGFNLPVYSKWSFSGSFEYLVGVSAAVAVHSFLQLLLNTTRLLRKSSIISSRNHAWLIFIGDQLFAYAMLSAGSAASGVTNLNRTGIKHSSLPNFCKPLHTFCDRVAVSITFTFFSCFLLATLAVLDVVWLSKY